MSHCSHAIVIHSNDASSFCRKNYAIVLPAWMWPGNPATEHHASALDCVAVQDPKDSAHMLLLPMQSTSDQVSVVQLQSSTTSVAAAWARV